MILDLHGRRIGNPDRRRAGFVRKPLDFYVAFLVFVIGAYGFFDPAWPESYPHPTDDILFFEDFYLLSASLAVMFALVCYQFRWLPVTAIVLEMFGWLFIACGASLIVVTSWWIPITALQGPVDVTWLWRIIWTGLAISAFTKFLELRIMYSHKESNDE